MGQHWTDQHTGQQGSYVQPEGTAVVYTLLCWKRAGPAQTVDFGDLLSWPADTKEILSS